MITNNLYLDSLIISLAIQIIFFIFASWLKTDKVTDLSYGLSFFILTIFLVIERPVDPIKTIIAISIIFWSVRLASYLLARIIKMKKDARFDGIRENFLRFARFWLFQAITVWIIMLPTIAIFNSNKTLELNLVSYLGITIWVIGIAIESIADNQKTLAKEKNPDDFVNTGLFSKARHPNYFGEMLCWWGIYLASTPYLEGWSWITIIGPIYITLILIYASGIKMLEEQHKKKYGEREDYKEYVKKTRLLIPI